MVCGFSQVLRGKIIFVERARVWAIRYYYIRRTSTHPGTFGFPLPRGGFALRYECAKQLGKISKFLWLSLNCAASLHKNQLQIHSYSSICTRLPFARQ